MVVMQCYCNTWLSCHSVRGLRCMCNHYDSNQTCPWGTVLRYLLNLSVGLSGRGLVHVTVKQCLCHGSFNQDVCKHNIGQTWSLQIQLCFVALQNLISGIEPRGSAWQCSSTGFQMGEACQQQPWRYRQCSYRQSLLQTVIMWCTKEHSGSSVNAGFWSIQHVYAWVDTTKCHVAVANITIKKKSPCHHPKDCNFGPRLMLCEHSMMVALPHYYLFSWLCRLPG